MSRDYHPYSLNRHALLKLAFHLEDGWMEYKNRLGGSLAAKDDFFWDRINAIEAMHTEILIELHGIIEERLSIDDD